MAYSVNGKTYTSHPLMDEIIYNCKLILNGIVLKNSEKANDMETVESVEDSDMYLAIMNGSVSLGFFPLTTSWLTQHGFAYDRAAAYINNRELLPKYVSCNLRLYNPKNKAKTHWNAAECRFEYEDGTIAGYNVNSPVRYNSENSRFEYYNGQPASGYIVGFTVPYYTNSKGELLFEHETKVNTYCLPDGTITNSTPISCMEAIFKEYANDYEVNEQNNYYRTLNGRPNYDTIENNIYLGYDVKNKTYYTFTKDKNGLELTHYNITAESSDEFIFEINPEIPIHEYQRKVIDTYEALGIMTQIRDLYLKRNIIDAANFRYLNYLGSKKISIYTSRTAAEWDILYMPTCEHLVSDRFKELFKINRDIYYNQTYQLAYSTQSNYYDEMLMLMVVAQTFADMIVDTPEWYIRRDIFDLRSVQYFLESHGVAFYEEIPLRYQILIVKNLNKLIKYKSTDKNINDIIALFSAKDAVVYEYYIFKKYLYTEGESNIIDGGSVDDTGWQDTGLIINGDFETGDTTAWDISMPGSYNLNKNTYGYDIVLNPYSTGGNTTLNLSFWNNTDEDHYFSLSQNVELGAGKYRLRFRQAGSPAISGLSIYANNTRIWLQTATEGVDKWETITTAEFELESLQTVTIKFSGEVNSNYTGNIDNITLYDYKEICDCGDEEEWEGPGPMPMTEPPFEFYDENSNDEYPTKRYLYDFGNEDADEIKSGTQSDAYSDLEEKNRIVSKT